MIGVTATLCVSRKRAGDEHQVMYDAMGVRRQAGYHATAINNLVTAFPSEAAFGRHAVRLHNFHCLVQHQIINL